jgi:hypothetical protein
MTLLLQRHITYSSAESCQFVVLYCTYIEVVVVVRRILVLFFVFIGTIEYSYRVKKSNQVLHLG